MLLGAENLQLLPYSQEHWEHLAKWVYADEYQDLFRHLPKALSENELRNFPIIAGGEVFLIVHKKDNIPVGICYLIPDAKKNRGVSASIMLTKEYQKQGLSIESFWVLFNYAFNKQGFRKVIVEVLESNESLIKLIVSKGFIYEGRLHGEAFIEGKFVNELRFCMFETYFNRHYKKGFK